MDINKNLYNVINSNNALKNKLMQYSELIYEYNKNTNITGFKDIDSIYNKLVLKSIEPFINFNVPRGTSFLDMGTGAGVPSIPVLLYLLHNSYNYDYDFQEHDLKDINLNFTLVDSNNKKIMFLKHVIKEFNLQSFVNIICDRVENLALDYSSSFDMVLSRGFSHPFMAVEYGLSFLKINGIIIIYYDIDINKLIEYYHESINLYMEQLLSNKLKDTSSKTINSQNQKSLKKMINEDSLQDNTFSKSNGYLNIYFKSLNINTLIEFIEYCHCFNKLHLNKNAIIDISSAIFRAYTMGEKLPSKDELLKSGINNGLIFIKKNPTETNYPRKYKLIKNDVVKIRNIISKNIF